MPLFGMRKFRISRGRRKKDKYTKKRPPVKRGEIIEVYVEDTSKKGDGVAKVEGFAIFIPSAKEGEVVRIKITEVKKNCAVAKVVE